MLELKTLSLVQTIAQIEQSFAQVRKLTFYCKINFYLFLGGGPGCINFPIPISTFSAFYDSYSDLLMPLILYSEDDLNKLQPPFRIMYLRCGFAVHKMDEAAISFIRAGKREVQVNYYCII